MAVSVVSIFIAATILAVTASSIIAWQLQRYVDDNDALSSSLTVQNEQLYVTAAALELNRMTDFLNRELVRVRLATNQTQRLALAKANTPAIRTSAGALAVMNQTLFDAWASRVTFPGELFGFGVNFLYPADTDNVTQVQSIQTYADPLLTGGLQPMHSWTDPASNTNYAYQISLTTDPNNEQATNNDARLPQLDMSVLQYTFDWSAPAIIGVGYASRFEFYQWQSADGNPWVFLQHSMATKIRGVNVVHQTYVSTVDWSEKMTPLILSENAYFVLYGKSRIPIASSYPPYEARRLACIANNSGTALLGCVSTPLADDAGLPLFQYFGRDVVPNASSLPRVSGLPSARYLRTTFGSQEIIAVLPEPIRVEGPAGETLELIWFRFGAVETISLASGTGSSVAVLIAMIIIVALLSTVGVGALVYRSFITPMDGMVDQMVAVTELDTEAIDAAMGGGRVVAQRNDSSSAQFAEVRRLQAAFAEMAASVQLFLLYLPRDVVRDLMASSRDGAGGPQQQGLVERQLTVLFVDIRNFTAYSAALRTRVQTFVELLQTYFERASGVLLEEGCTIDKYIGDAIMGFWGAPLECAEQCALGCTSALRLAEEVEKMRPEFAAHEWDLAVRVGVHSGPAMVGSIGSKKRLNFTALGNTVNVASRLESLCKTTKTPILVSGAVLEGVAAAQPTTKGAPQFKTLPVPSSAGLPATSERTTSSHDSVVVGDFIAYRVGLYQLKGTDEALAAHHLCGFAMEGRPSPAAVTVRRRSRQNVFPRRALPPAAVKVLQCVHDGQLKYDSSEGDAVSHFTEARRLFLALSLSDAQALWRAGVDDDLLATREAAASDARLDPVRRMSTK